MLNLGVSEGVLCWEKDDVLSPKWCKISSINCTGAWVRGLNGPRMGALARATAGMGIT